MLDTLVLSQITAITLPTLAQYKAGDTFVLHGLDAGLSSLKAKSNFAKQGYSLFLQCYDPASGIHISGPVRSIPAGMLFLPHIIRLNIPRLAALPPGCLPTSDQDIRRALDSAVDILDLLPADWLQMAKVKQVDLAMNFALDPVEMLELHQHMRHARVKKDPFKSAPDHGSLYWNGSQLVICLYDKSRHLNELAAKRSSDPLATASYPPLVRLEFRLHSHAATRCLNYAQRPEPIPCAPGIPPLPTPIPGDFSVHDLNAKTLFAMYRHLLSDFPDLPRRNIKRLTTQELVAIGIQEHWVLRDGRTILDYYRAHADAKDVRYAQKLSLELDVGRPLFRWLEVVPADGWGPLAMPFVLPLLPQPPASAGARGAPWAATELPALPQP